MDNQHRKISGYRELTQDEIDLMNEIKAKGLELEALIKKVEGVVEAEIAGEYYFTAGDGVHAVQTKGDPDGTSVYPEGLDSLTFCVLTLRNGFTVTGESACASPENFDAEIGRKIARQNAVQKVKPDIFAKTYEAVEVDTFETRLRREQQELNARVTALRAFANKGYPQANERQRDLLEQQLVYMTNYLEVLEERLHDLGT